jgi:hypothetical protein
VRAAYTGKGKMTVLVPVFFRRLANNIGRAQTAALVLDKPVQHPIKNARHLWC